MLEKRIPIHTTIDEKSNRICSDFEKKIGVKNKVIDLALWLMEEFCKKNNLMPQELEKFLKRSTFGNNIGIDLGEGFTAEVCLIRHDIFNGRKVGTIETSFDSENNQMTITHKFSDKAIGDPNFDDLLGRLYPRMLHFLSQGFGSKRTVPIGDGGRTTSESADKTSIRQPEKTGTAIVGPSADNNGAEKIKVPGEPEVKITPEKERKDAKAAFEPVIRYREDAAGGKNISETLSAAELTQEQREAMANTGINLTGVNILRVIIKTPNITQIKIARKLGVSKAVIYQIVRGFSSKGFINKMNSVGRDIPLSANFGKIGQEFGALIRAGLLLAPEEAAVSGEAAKEEDDARKEKTARLQEIALQKILEIARSAERLVSETQAKSCPIEELANKLRTSVAAVKQAINTYRENGGRTRIRIEETDENCIVYV